MKITSYQYQFFYSPFLRELWLFSKECKNFKNMVIYVTNMDIIKTSMHYSNF